MAPLQSHDRIERDTARAGEQQRQRRGQQREVELPTGGLLGHETHFHESYLSDQDRSWGCNGPADGRGGGSRVTRIRKGVGHTNIHIITSVDRDGSSGLNGTSSAKCHAERSEASLRQWEEIPRFARNDNDPV